MLAARCTPSTCAAATSGRRAAAALRQWQARQWGSKSGSSGGASRTLSTWPQRQHCASQPLPVLAASDGSTAEPALAEAADELPLWRFLQQQGFSADSISRMQAATFVSGGRRYAVVSGRQMSEAKVQRDLAGNIAALRAESLDTASIERMFEQCPVMLTTTLETFASALAALRQLAALLPDDPRAVQAPPGATPLGVALWRYSTSVARLLARANLGSLIDGNLGLRRQLGVSDAATAARLLRQNSALVSDFERAEAMVAHLQRLQASGALSAEQVVGLALTAALKLTPAEFDRRWQEGRLSDGNMGDLNNIALKDPVGRQRAAAEALGEVLQAADGVPGLLQQQYQQQGEALVKRERRLWAAGPFALRAGWASLQQLGLSSSQVVAVVQLQPNVLALNWESEAKQRLLAWVQQELGLSPYDFLTHHAGYCTSSIAKIAMRADYLRQHHPSVWESKLARGSGPLLSLLSESRFCARAGCTKAELDAFNRAWLATPTGRRWGAKARREKRHTASAA